MLEEEFLNKPFLYLLFCKTHLGISFTTTASVNSMGRGFKLNVLPSGNLLILYLKTMVPKL